eukprot:1144707-Ditylum_brightwellii.AAC.1
MEQMNRGGDRILTPSSFSPNGNQDTSDDDATSTTTDSDSSTKGSDIDKKKDTKSEFDRDTQSALEMEK